VNGPIPPPASTGGLVPNVLGSPPGVLEVRAKPWAALVMGLPMLAIVLLYLGMVGTPFPGQDATGEVLLLQVILPLVLVPAFLVLSASALLSLMRVWDGTPFLRIDRQGLVWGRDRHRDIALDWTEIKRIETKRMTYRGYRHRFLVVVPKDPDVLARYPFLKRLESWLAGGMIGHLAIGTIGSTVPFVQLVSELQRHFDGPIDLADKP
jgi:hypothetical protein